MRAPILLLIVLLSFGRAAFALEYCSEHTPEDKRCRIKLSQTRPTQFSVGLREVVIKKDKIAKAIKKDKEGGFVPDELEKYMKSKPIDVVIGPGGVAYAIDGHHFALAAMFNGIEEAHAVVTHNYSHLSVDDFWAKMVKERLVYLFNKGDGPLDPRLLDESFYHMSDDPYRSLASAAKDAGAFKKSHNRFFEYIWAEFFRMFIVIEPGEEGFQLALKAAVALARTDLADGLPGHHKGHDKCSDILVRENLKKFVE